MEKMNVVLSGLLEVSQRIKKKKRLILYKIIIIHVHHHYWKTVWLYLPKITAKAN